MSEQESMHVVVTGATGLIGGAVCRSLIADGHRISLVARSQEGLTSLRESLTRDVPEAGPVAAIALEIDPLRDNGEEIMMAAEDRLGPAQGLVNCAGTAISGDPIDVGTLGYMSAMNTKFGTCVTMSLAAAHRFRSRGTGSIINIAGVGGVLPFPTFLTGGSANAALLLFTQGLARHLGLFGARAIAVSPSRTYASDVPLDPACVDSTPFGRNLNADDVAATVCFLLRPGSEYISGSNIVIDGAKRHSQ